MKRARRQAAPASCVSPASCARARPGCGDGTSCSPAGGAGLLRPVWRLGRWCMTMARGGGPAPGPPPAGRLPPPLSRQDPQPARRTWACCLARDPDPSRTCGRRGRRAPPGSLGPPGPRGRPGRPAADRERRGRTDAAAPATATARPRRISRPGARPPAPGPRPSTTSRTTRPCPRTPPAPEPRSQTRQPPTRGAPVTIMTPCLSDCGPRVRPERDDRVVRVRREWLS